MISFEYLQIEFVSHSNHFYLISKKRKDFLLWGNGRVLTLFIQNLVTLICKTFLTLICLNPTTGSPSHGEFCDQYSHLHSAVGHARWTNYVIQVTRSLNSGLIDRFCVILDIIHSVMFVPGCVASIGLSLSLVVAGTDNEWVSLSIYR